MIYYNYWIKLNLFLFKLSWQSAKKKNFRFGNMKDRN